MNTQEEINELKLVIKEAITSCKVSKLRCEEMIRLYPEVGNEKYLQIDKYHLKILESILR